MTKQLTSPCSCEIENEGNALDPISAVVVNCRPKAMPGAYLASFFYVVVMTQSSNYYWSHFWSPDFGANKLKGLEQSRRWKHSTTGGKQQTHYCFVWDVWKIGCCTDTVFGIECCLKYIGERRVPVRLSQAGCRIKQNVQYLLLPFVVERTPTALYAFCLFGDQSASLAAQCSSRLGQMRSDFSLTVYNC
jgi:hypothetical protein